MILKNRFYEEYVVVMKEIIVMILVVSIVCVFTYINDKSDGLEEYVDWYYKEGGSEDIEEYWGKLQEIAIEYRVDHSDFTGGVVKELSQNQIEELMKKEADPTYKIDNSVMGVN